MSAERSSRERSPMVGVRAPTGTVTFLFTDIEVDGAVAAPPPEMSDALARHDALLQDAISASGGAWADCKSTANAHFDDGAKKGARNRPFVGTFTTCSRASGSA